MFIIGVAGSGKSTLLRALAGPLRWRALEADELHEPSNIEKMRRGIPLDDHDRWPWLEAVATRVSALAARGESVVVACSALKRAHRDRLRAAAPQSLFVYLHADLALAEARMASRSGHFMPPVLARSQFEALEPPDPSESALTVAADQPIDRTVDRVLAYISYIRRGGS